MYTYTVMSKEHKLFPYIYLYTLFPFIYLFFFSHLQLLFSLSISLCTGSDPLLYIISQYINVSVIYIHVCMYTYIQIQKRFTVKCKQSKMINERRIIVRCSTLETRFNKIIYPRIYIYLRSSVCNI